MKKKILIIAMLGLIFLSLTSVSAELDIAKDKKHAEFKKIDTNNDNRISFEEFKNITSTLKHWLFFNNDVYDNIIPQIFKKVDLNNDTYLSYEEYLNA